MSSDVTVEVPAEVLLELHLSSDGMARLLKEKAAIALFGEGRLSSGLAARWLGIPRSQFLLQAMAAGASLLDDSADDFRREESLSR